MKTLYRIRLDHGQPVNQHSAGMLILLGLGILALGVVMIDLQRVSHETEQLQSRISQDQMSARISDDVLRLHGKENAVKRDEMNAVQMVVTELDIPWNTLFTMLESLDISNVRLLGVEPNAKQHRLQLSAESATTDDMFGYVAALTNQPILSHVLLLTHERSEDGRQLPISFVIEATWRN